MEVLKDVDDWFVFGVKLGVPVKELRKIESSHGREFERCKIDMLEYWLDNTVDASWNEVEQTLKKTNHLLLATEVKQKYLRSDQGLVCYVM